MSRENNISYFRKLIYYFKSCEVSPTVDEEDRLWNNIMSVNLNSVYNCCHFAVQDMLRRHCGKIINISSVWGLYGASCEVAYSATKGQSILLPKL